MIDNLKSPTALSPQKRKLLDLLLKEKGIATNLPTQTLSRRPRPEFMPLAMNQEGLWFLDQLDPGKNHYNIPGTVRLQGRLDIAALEKSLNEIVRRHETLRTTFAVQADGTPYQVIAPPQTFMLPLFDLQGLSSTERKDEAVRRATAAAQKTFELSRGPLFHTQLLRLEAEEHVFILNLHHIIADGWSMGVFTQELRVLYEAFSQGKSSPLPELPIQYGDFAIWEREQNRREVLEARLTYWKNQLDGKLPILELPADRPRPPVQSFQGSHQSLMVDKPLTAALKTLSQREGVTLYMTLLTIFKTLLYRYTGQSDVIVGAGIANRERRELENLIGYFATVLPLRTNLAGNPTFRELLQRVRKVILDANAHQGLPFARLVQELQPERDPSRNPIYQAEFTLLTPDRNPAVYGYGMSPVMETITFSGLTMTPFEVENGIARFDLAVFIWDMPDGLQGTVEYNTDLFETTTVARLVKNFATLSRLIVTQPEVRLNAVIEQLAMQSRQQQIIQEKSYKENMQRKLKNLKRK